MFFQNCSVFSCCEIPAQPVLSFGLAVLLSVTRGAGLGLHWGSHVLWWPLKCYSLTAKHYNRKCRFSEFAFDKISELQKFYVKYQNKFPNKYTPILSLLSAPDGQIQDTLAETLCLHKATIKVSILGDFGYLIPWWDWMAKALCL